MQHKSEHWQPTASTPSPYKLKSDGLSVEKESLLLLPELVDVQQHSFHSNSSDGFVGRTEESQAREQPGKRSKRGLSPTAWQLLTLLGGGVLLASALMLVLLLVALFHLTPRVPRYDPDMRASLFVWGCLIFVSWSIASKIAQVQALMRVSHRLSSLLSAMVALVLMLIFLILIPNPFRPDGVVNAEVLLYYLVVAASTLVIWRVVFAEIINLPRIQTQAVIIGATTAGEIIAEELSHVERSTVNVLGYISAESNESSPERGLPILGGKSTLRSLVRNGMIDMIIMAIDYDADPELFREAIEAAQLGISVVPMAVVYERTSGKIPVEHVGEHWYVALPTEVVVSSLYLCWRKVMDIVFGVLGTAVMLLLLPVLALLIYWESPGPIFYKQERLGFRGRNFFMYKFRSMYPDAEPAGHALWATEHDTRVTRIGRFMRAAHLDELPQVLNILRGEMSLIGPRPERQAFVTELENIIPFYRCRLKVKPGLTGWAQVMYTYARTEQESLIKLQYDLYYIKHQSFTLDIVILLKTVVEVLRFRQI